MPVGGPQATPISENPVRTSGIDAEPGEGPPATRPTGRRVASLLLPPLVVMAAIWWLSAQPDLSSGLEQDLLLRKVAHVTEYAVLTLSWARAVAGLAPRGRARRAAPALAAAVALGWAVSDEWHQTFVPGRVGSPRDVAIDAVGIAVALALLRRTPVGHLVFRGPGGRGPAGPGTP